MALFYHSPNGGLGLLDFADFISSSKELCTPKIERLFGHTHL
jgi:hypothetical protein